MKQNNSIPPKLAKRLLLRYLRDDLAEEVEGDLEENFHAMVKTKSLFKARLNYWFQAFHYIRPFALKKNKSYPLNHYDMFQSYFKIGWRNLLKNKGYSIINIGGLAIGLAVALLNGLWVRDELSFNKYYQNYDRIAQVAVSGIHEGQQFVGTTQTYLLGTELTNNHHHHFKHIVRSARRDYILSSGDTKFSTTGLFMDQGAPEMFTFNMVHGSWNSLKETHSIMISVSLAKNLFADENPLNKVITMNNKTNVIVSGVYEDFPANTDFANIKFFCTWNLFLLENPWIEQRAINWRNHFIQIYVEILPTTTFENVNAGIKNAIRYDPADAEKFTEEKRHALLYPMSRWHLFPYFRGVVDEGPVKMVWLVGSIGAFVLLLASINFMNLSTARSEKRAKEVGIRKTIGSVRSQLIQQFFSESFLVVILSFLIALLMVKIALPAFNNLTSKQLDIPWSTPMFWTMSFGFVLFTGLLAGSYPALYLSSFKPIKVLKGTFRTGRVASIPRKVLVVMQFSISVTLMVGTVVVYQQIQHAKNRPVGYTREGVIMIQKRSGDFYGKHDVLRNELINTGVVEEVSESMGPVTEVVSGNDGWDWKDRHPDKKESFATLAVSHSHGKTMGWQFLLGRDFSREIPSDSAGVVINEAALKYMELKDPIGEPISWSRWQDQSVLNYKILGVVKDMVMDSPYKPTEPAIFFIKGHGPPSWINIKVRSTASMNETLPKIEAVFKKIIPSAPFEYQFVDDAYALKFAAEERIGRLSFVFGTLAIFISCLGLFGLASFVAEQRTKEIGIRKVLGATVANLCSMLSKEFVLLVILSCLISIPIAWYFLNGWLEKYPYRIEISAWTFIATSTAAVLITLMTVSYQAVKAALMNPVNSLRSE